MCYLNRHCRCLGRSGKRPDFLRERMIINELSLLLNKFNGILMYWLGSFFLIAIASVIFNAAGAVALWRVRMFIIAFVTCVLLLYCSNRCATVYEESTKLRILRQSRSSTQWLAKSWTTLRPLRFYVGPFVYADRGLSLNLLSVMVTNTASLLMEARLLCRAW